MFESEEEEILERVYNPDEDDYNIKTNSKTETKLKTETESKTETKSETVTKSETETENNIYSKIRYICKE